MHSVSIIALVKSVLAVTSGGNDAPENVLFRLAVDMDAKALFQFSLTNRAANQAFKPIFAFKTHCGVPLSKTWPVLSIDTSLIDPNHVELCLEHLKKFCVRYSKIQIKGVAADDSNVFKVIEIATAANPFAELDLLILRLAVGNIRNFIRSIGSSKTSLTLYRPVWGGEFAAFFGQQLSLTNIYKLDIIAPSWQLYFYSNGRNDCTKLMPLFINQMQYSNVTSLSIDCRYKEVFMVDGEPAPVFSTSFKGLLNTSLTSFSIMDCSEVRSSNVHRLVRTMPQTLEKLDIGFFRNFLMEIRHVPTAIFSEVFLLPRLEYLTLRNFASGFLYEWLLDHALVTNEALKNVRMVNCEMVRLRPAIMKQMQLSYVPGRYNHNFVFDGLANNVIQTYNDELACCSIA